MTTFAPPPPEWFSPSSAVVSVALGAAAAWLTAELKQRRKRREVFERQRHQVALAAAELLSSLQQIAGRAHGLAFLNEHLVYDQPARPQTWAPSDPYYLKYALVATVYRLCAVLGWMEVYRNDATFFVAPARDRRRLEGAFAALRGALAAEGATPADGAGAAPARWGAFILEDDQRAIGEQMFGTEHPAKVIGYAAFCERLFRRPSRDDPAGGDARSQNHWVWNATLFVLDFGTAPAAAGPRRPNTAQAPRLAALAAALERLAVEPAGSSSPDVRRPAGGADDGRPRG